MRQLTRSNQSPDAGATCFVVVGLLATLALLGTRIAWRTHYPFDFDCANYALAVTDFDVPTHQPHPPGSPLFVMAARVLVPLTADPHLALEIVVWLCSVVAVWFAMVAVRRIGGSPGAAAVVLVTSPAFWFAGEIAEPYVCDAMLFVGALAIAAGPEAIGRARTKRTMALVLFISLGTGLRPSTAAFLLPFCLVEACKLKSWRAALVAMGLFGIGCAAWVFPMIADSGGLAAYLVSYSRLKPLFEARWASHGWMVLRLILWTLAIAAPALLLFLATWRNRHALDARNRDLLWKCAIAVPPVWFFYATVHFADCLYSVAFCGLSAVVAGLFAVHGSESLRWSLVALVGFVQCASFLFADQVLNDQFLGRTTENALKHQDARSDHMNGLIDTCAEDYPLIVFASPKDWPHGGRILQYLRPKTDFCIVDAVAPPVIGRSFYREPPEATVFAAADKLVSVDENQSICLAAASSNQCECGLAADLLSGVSVPGVMLARRAP